MNSNNWSSSFLQKYPLPDRKREKVWCVLQASLILIQESEEDDGVDNFNKIMVVVKVMTTTIFSSTWKIMLRNLWGENCSGLSQICGSMCVAMKLAASPVPCRWCIFNSRLSMHCYSSYQQNPSHHQHHRHLSSISGNLWQSLAVDVKIFHSNNFWRVL